MQSSRDPSLLRSLAVAFGDGLAFGVGVKLSQNAAKKAGPSSSGDTAPLAARVVEIEKRLERIEESSPLLPASAAMNFDQHALNALVTSFESRLEEHAAHLERQIAELEVRIALELKSLRQQDQSLSSAITGMHDQFIALHREFAEAVGAIVETQVAAQVEAGVDKLQQAVGAAVEEKLGAMREQIEAKASEISTLQERLQESDRNVLEVILGMGELCRQVGDRLSHQPKSKEAPGDEDAPPSAGVPGFAQHSGRSVLQVPLVSSLAITAVGLYLLYFL